MTNEIRDSIITGSYAIGANGQKEPLDWKDYALKLEAALIKSTEDEYNEHWMEVIEKVEKDNKCMDFYSGTVTHLQRKFLLLKIYQ